MGDCLISPFRFMTNANYTRYYDAICKWLDAHEKEFENEEQLEEATADYAFSLMCDNVWRKVKRAKVLA